MSKSIEKAQKLETEARAIRRAEKRFWRSIDERSEEIIAYLAKKGKLTPRKEIVDELPSESTEPYEVWS